MRLLLDTHVLLWWLADDPALGERAREAIADPRNDVLVSAISRAEIAIKASLGKLEIPEDFDSVLDRQPFDGLPFAAEHAVLLRGLPWRHRDPFDRMLIAQATFEKLCFVTADERCLAYDIRVL